MDSNEPVMINISKYLTDIFIKASLETFKDFLPEKFDSQVVWNTLGTSDLTSPIAMKIYNLCNKKENWKYSSAKEVAEELIKNLKDEKSIIEETKIESQTPKKNQNEKKKKTNASNIIYRYKFKIFICRRFITFNSKKRYTYNNKIHKT